MTDGAVDYKVGDTHKVEVRTHVRQFHFCKNSGKCGEKKFHRKIQRNSYKNSPLSAHSTLKARVAHHTKIPVIIQGHI